MKAFLAVFMEVLAAALVIFAAAFGAWRAGCAPSGIWSPQTMAPIPGGTESIPIWPRARGNLYHYT